MSKTKISRQKTRKTAGAVSRRSLLKTAAAAGSVAAIGPWFIKDARSSSGSLDIMMWSDYLPQAFTSKFKEATGITINHTPYGSNEELIQKMRATKGRGFDLISPTNDRTGQWQDLDLLQTFDMNRVPTDAILPSMLKIFSTITDPPSKPGSKAAATVISGSRLLRNTWRHTTPSSDTPLARAVRA